MPVLFNMGPTVGRAKRSGPMDRFPACFVLALVGWDARGLVRLNPSPKRSGGFRLPTNFHDNRSNISLPILVPSDNHSSFSIRHFAWFRSWTSCRMLHETRYRFLRSSVDKRPESHAAPRTSSIFLPPPTNRSIQFQSSFQELRSIAPSSRRRVAGAKVVGQSPPPPPIRSSSG